MTLRVACIVGARPNFMKVAPIMRAMGKRHGVTGLIVHTGQHYNANMSDVFFAELGIPAPDINLEVGSDTHARQTSAIMRKFEAALPDLRPAVVLVVGDVNSTIACALVAVRAGLPVVHVEAGLRSFDRSMPEEVNRVLTDRISDALFVTEESGRRNLAREGIEPERVYFPGNTMIDTLVHRLPAVERSSVQASLGLEPGGYAVVTYHRPSNVDRAERLAPFVEVMEWIASQLPVVFPVHPRTRARLEEAELWGRLTRISGLTLSEPQPYTDFMALIRGARFVLTDSGGIQEETTYLGVPCLTQRTSTERPVTIDQGTNVLLGEDFAKTRGQIELVLSGGFKSGQVPPSWDGLAAERIVDALLERYA